jgi:hypothetical protein
LFGRASLWLEARCFDLIAAISLHGLGFALLKDSRQGGRGR